jgi:hydroxymethylglutaryl-CoA lyase
MPACAWGHQVRRLDRGLGGCPFAATDGAAGNICTEDFAFMCEEMGVGPASTSIADRGRPAAEEVVGRPCPAT